MIKVEVGFQSFSFPFFPPHSLSVFLSRKSDETTVSSVSMVVTALYTCTYFLQNERTMTEVKTKQIDDNEVTKRLVKDETDNKTDDDDKLSSIKLFRKRLNEDTFFRQKFAIFVCICYSFLITVSRM